MRDTRGGRAPRQIVSLRFSATDMEVRGALLRVEEALTRAGIAPELRTRAQIAIAEACNNIVEHAYPATGATADPAITLDLGADRGGLQVTLRDRGGPMPDNRLPGDDLPDIDPEDPLGLPEGGFGWPLLRGMARALSLTRRNNQNILRFRLPLTETPTRQG